MDQQSFSHTFNVPETSKLTVENVRGSVIIRQGSKGQITVNAEIDPRSGRIEQTHVNIRQDSDQTVRAITETDKMTGIFGGINPCKVHYVIDVPTACSVNLNCVSSSAVLDGIQGSFSLHMISGSLALTNMGGGFELHTVSGPITGLRLEGNMEIHTVSGGVKLGECRLDTMRAKTVSGSLTMESPITSGPYHFNSVSGEVRLIVPPETNCEVTLSTMSGNAYVGLSSTYHQRTRRVQQITVQDGGPEVYMHSVSGGLVIVTPNQLDRPAPDQPDLSATQAESDEPDRIAILDRIGRGEISVEEGIRLLEGNLELG
jgi:hypothetical protein